MSNILCIFSHVEVLSQCRNKGSASCILTTKKIIAINKLYLNQICNFYNNDSANQSNQDVLGNGSSIFFNT